MYVLYIASIHLYLLSLKIWTHVGVAIKWLITKHLYVILFVFSSKHASTEFVITRYENTSRGKTEKLWPKRNRAHVCVCVCGQRHMYVCKSSDRGQGCQMVCFQTKNPNLSKFWRVLQWNRYVGIFYGHLVHFTDFCYNLWTFGIVHGNLVYFSSFCILYQEKSGNPDRGLDMRLDVTDLRQWRA
jgi:hypothetical protein